MIFMPTCLHTGTVFLVNVWKSRPNTHVVTLEDVLFHGASMREDALNVVQTHVLRGLPSEKDNKRYVVKHNRTILEALTHFRSVTTLRDPLLSIVTRHRRFPEWAPHTYIVDSFLELMSLSRKLSMYPVRVDDPDADRRKMLHDMAVHAQCDPWPALGDIADQWDPKNKTHTENYLLKEYRDGDMRSMATRYEREVKMLRDNQQWIWRFMQDAGYTRKPIWLS